jgi:polar amino acid transport system substrate-binding protein
MKIKSIVCATAAIVGAGVISLGATGCSSDTIYVDTNAFFAPFEYYKGTEIVGVDVDIMNLVGEKLGKKVEFQNTDFGVIIDNVSQGKKYDCGAAGITITDERKEQVDFSDPYYTSVQYVVAKSGTIAEGGVTSNGTAYVLWTQLAGKKIGVQTDTTGDIYCGDETADGGIIGGTGASVKQYDSAQLAVDALTTYVDVVVVDKLPAEYIVKNNTSANLVCYPLYYDAETATEEQYAICVTKGNTSLLNAINEVLKELGEDGIEELVSKHLGLTA